MAVSPRIRSAVLVSAVAAAWLSLPAAAASAPRRSPDARVQQVPSGQPVQVYVLLGQSNMLGFGRVGPAEQQGTLESLVHGQGAYPFLVDGEAHWVERDDVRYVHVMDERGADFRDMSRFARVKNEWLTVTGNFGPELGFGHVVGELHEEPVLLLKACIGNRSLGWDLLPPGSERFEYEGRSYAGYGDADPWWTEEDPYDPNAARGWYAGRQYDADTSHAKAVLADLETYLPGYAGQGYEIAGFVFWQGHKDQDAALASRYEQNLVRFIRALREDFDAPAAKFVLATIAFGGADLAGAGLTVCEAQLAVDGASGKYPEFRGNVAAVDARPFWRAREVSPSGQGHHYHHNAETYMEVGLALGRAMTTLQAPNEVVPPDLESARAAWEAAPDDESAIIWYGRRTAYTGDYAAAVEIFSDGLRKHPGSVRLLRHRGHRWLSLREFDRAVEDLSLAARRIVEEGTSDRVEADGMPNARGIPTSTLHTNIWYHLALAHYCRGEFAEAQRCWTSCLAAAGNPDMECAARYWLFHAATRAGDAAAAAAALEPVRAEWDVIENHAYQELLLLYRGDRSVSEVAPAGERDLEDVTRRYGLARWYAIQRDAERSRQALHALAATGSAAFACIAAEADLARDARWSDAVRADPRWLYYAPEQGAAGGRRVVLIAGDEEYRSEEALPKLAECLAGQGAECVVLFSQDPTSGYVDPEQRVHLPGLHLLEDADLLVLATRFRSWGDEDMRHFTRFLARGGPVVGLRTATHAFRWPGDAPTAYSEWGFAATDGGFGGRILGETWVAHHGAHGQESTRGIHEPGAADHPVLRGVGEPWGPTDVYSIRGLPEDARVLLRGSVRAGMEPDAPAMVDDRNAPMMPLAWTRERRMDDGAVQRVVCTTMGAARDLMDASLRRLLVQGALWAMGLEEAIPPDGVDVDLADAEWSPTPFGFGGHRRERLPADFR